MNLKPLDLEKLADEIIRVEYPAYEQATPLMKNVILRRKHAIKIILEQYLKSVLQGFTNDVENLSYRMTIVDIKNLIKKWFPDVV